MGKKEAYDSVLGKYIEGFIAEKQAQGYTYQAQAYLMKSFDSYWKEHEYTFIGLTPASLDDWLEKRESESMEYVHNRISVIREFSKYLNGLGILSYIPQNIRRTRALVHVLSDEEVADFFCQVDQYQPVKKNADHIRMAEEYPVLFRLIYCCGLRRSEACLLAVSQVDLNNGIITILNAKGNKDRLVYLSEDMHQLLIEYLRKMRSEYSAELEWLFPGRDIRKPIAAATASRIFDCFWIKTRYSENIDTAPTLHALRHTFVVKRINQWMKVGLDFNTMLPYLSKYLGHKGIDETYYYYHYVKEAALIIQSKDTVASKVIPKARRR